MDRREKPVYFDVDDTLLMWHGRGLWGPEEPGTIPVVDIFDGATLYLKPHKKMIDELLRLHARGMYIVVWSAAGYEWAKSAVEALNLNDKVHLIIGKPIMMFDDLPTEQGIGKTKYIPYEEV